MLKNWGRYLGNGMLKHWGQHMWGRFRSETEQRMLALPFDVFAVGIAALLFWWIESWLKDDPTTRKVVGIVLCLLASAWLVYVSCVIIANSRTAVVLRQMFGVDRGVKSRHIAEVRKYAETMFWIAQNDMSVKQASDAEVVYELLWSLLNAAHLIEQYANARGELGGERIEQSPKQQIEALKVFVTNGMQYSVDGRTEPETTLRFLIGNPLTHADVKRAAESYLVKVERRGSSESSQSF